MLPGVAGVTPPTMGDSGQMVFGPFQLHPQRGELRRDGAVVPLQPKPMAVLCYLAARPGRTVGREELLGAVWTGTYVTKAALRVAVRAIREALEETAEAPRYLETVGREGYRFIGTTRGRDGRGAQGEPETPQAAGRPAARRVMVGRAAELERMSAALGSAAGGARRLVLVAGDAGVGKTTLLDAFLADVRTRTDAWIGHGQCLEQYGDSEPYLPILEALGRLCREADKEGLVRVLREHAPTWVAQIPGVLAAPEREALVASGLTATPERMLRELADALALSADGPLIVLALEDLHWSDRSTLDFVSYVARRREPARLLIVGTYRPTEVIVHDHPLGTLKQQLVAAELCQEIVLELLTETEVREYLGHRLGPSPDLEALAAAIHARTDGHALFMASAVDDLLARRVVATGGDGWRLTAPLAEASHGIPQGVRELIEQQTSALASDLRLLLEVASVAGAEFAADAVASALGRSPMLVEDQCEQLVQRGQFIEEAGLAEWPDGTVSGAYRFRHALHRHVLYGRITEPRRVRLHRAIALRLESAFGARAADVAAELALHFDRGRDAERGAAYHEIAGRSALERHAPHEAITHLSAALALGADPGGDVAAMRHALGLQVALATALMAARGYAAPEVRDVYQRARGLCRSLGTPSEAVPVLRGLISYHHVRAELAAARDLGTELLADVTLGRDVHARVQLDYGQGATLFHMGAFVEAQGHFAAALAAYDEGQHAQHARLYGGYDPGVACTLWSAWTALFLGRPAEMDGLAERALALAERLGQPFTLAWALVGMAVAHQLVGAWEPSRRLAARSMALAGEQGFAYILAQATIRHGWARVMLGDVDDGGAELQHGLALHEATGAELVLPAYRLMAAALELRAGRLDEAAALVADARARVARSSEGLHEVDVLCMDARVRLTRARTHAGKVRAGLQDEAETLLEQALATARGQEARTLELRAATMLAESWRHCGRDDEARALLAPIYGRFGDDDSADLRAAARVLEDAPG